MADGEAILNTFTIRALRSLAKEHGVGLSRCRLKADIVNRLLAAEAVRAKLGTVPFRARPALAAKTLAQLRVVAADHGVDVSGCTKRADFLERIAASPAGEAIVAALAVPAPPRVPRPDVAHPQADVLLRRARNADVDFGLVEDVLDQARMRFEERNYERAMELAREALMLARGTVEAFDRAAWSYALFAAEQLVTESGKMGPDLDAASSLLRDAKVAYVSGNLAANQDVLVKLQAATKALYSEEVQRLRDAIYGTQERVAQTRHIGGDVAAAEEALARAQDAMTRAEHGRALAFVADAERLAGEALAKRVQEIADAIPATVKVLEDARHLGADLDEAQRLLEKARVAVDRKEYVLAAELVQRAERAALQAQHYQIQKAMELRVRQIERVRALVESLVAVAEEGAAYGLDVEAARRYLADARGVLDEGDYVNGTMLAKQAEDAIRHLEPRLVEERARRGITKPTAGQCPTCGSPDVVFQDNGWSRCNACTASWRWPPPSGLWERFRAKLRE